MIILLFFVNDAATVFRVRSLLLQLWNLYHERNVSDFSVTFEFMRSFFELG